MLLLDFFFPRHSLTGEGSVWVTEEELRQLQSRPVILTTPQLRSQGMQSIDRIVAAADYDAVPLLHRAVHLLKYKKVKEVGRILGAILADIAKNHESRSMNHECVILCPVPLHWLRRFARGFNQSELLAREVARRRGWVVQNLLRRTRWTGSQVGRHRKERLTGVKDAFHFTRGRKIPERVILVDDLSTTGATLDACACALKQAGVKNVEGLVLAMG